MTSVKELYAISDIYFAAYLRIFKCDLIRSKKDGNRTLFLFADTPQLQDLKIKYYNKSDESKVTPLDFANSVKDLKSLCYMS
jgi:hypothetical protein